MSSSKYAARLNSLRVGPRERRRGPGSNITTLDLLDRAAKTKGLNCVDFNYPDHILDVGEREIAERLGDLGLALNGYAMRYYSGDAFTLGAFTHPDPASRRAAIDLTKRGLDSLARALSRCGGTSVIDLFTAGILTPQRRPRTTCSSPRRVASGAFGLK